MAHLRERASLKGLRTAKRLFHRCIREPFVAALNTVALLRKVSALGEEIVSGVAGFDTQRLGTPPGREPLQCIGEHRTGAPFAAPLRAIDSGHFARPLTAMEAPGHTAWPGAAAFGSLQPSGHAAEVSLTAPGTFQQAHRVDRDTVEVDGVHFTSRVLSKLIDSPKTVYPLISTIGRELDELSAPASDMWQRICLDTIKTIVLVSGIEYLSGYLKDKYSLDGTAYMNPGEIDDFPISQQIPLFSLFGGVEKQIGVTLTAGGAMKPIKSRSGILFPDNSGFLSCRLCTQRRCPGRSAAYEPELLREFLS